MAYPPFLARWLVRTGLARWLPAVNRWIDGGGSFVHYYSDRIATAPFDDLLTAGAWLEPPGLGVIDLGHATPRFDLVPSGSTKLAGDRRGWPPAWGLPELRDAVAEQWQARLPEESEVLITAGATAALHTVVDTFLNPGDRVVLFDPTSPLFSLALGYRRARLRWVPTWVEDGYVRFRYEHLVKALRGARMIIFNAPASPTGGVYMAEDLEQLAWWARRRDVLIVHDDVFGRFHYEGNRTSIGSFPGAQARTLVIGSVSKGHGLAAARVGWIAGHRHLIRPCALTTAFHAPFVPTLCQQIALNALRQGDASFATIKDEHASKRRYAFDRLRSVGLQPAWPAGGLSLWVPIRDFGVHGHEFATRLLAAKKVVIWPGEFFGPSGSDHVRVSYAGDDGRLREGLSRLADFLTAARGSGATPGSSHLQAA